MIFDLVQAEKKCVARFISPSALIWLSQRLEGRVFQAFERSCNLINSQGAILSLVSTELGPGPFAITVEREGSPRIDTLKIWDEVNLFSRVRFSVDQIQIGSIRVDLSKAAIWNPVPAWEAILPGNLAQTYRILSRLLSFHSTAYDSSKNERFKASTSILLAASMGLSMGLRENDIGQARRGAKKIAGLGCGLTPAGDDFLMGFIYSLWSQWDSRKAQDWASELVRAAAPQTTQLSATWLEAAANGQAAEPWHRLVEAMLGANTLDQIDAANRILATGHTSGSDALTGYVAGLTTLTSLPQLPR
jgi:hypothetical protein